jgi:amine acid ABC transporter, permease protein, 3-TM region, His/Glu/Gln/Arg/opine family
MDWLTYLPSLAQGALVTAWITLASIAIGAALAFTAGIARVEGGRAVSTLALCYTEVFRGTSLLVQLFWLYYALPLVGLSFDPVTTGIVGLSLHVGAYGSVPMARRSCAERSMLCRWRSARRRGRSTSGACTRSCASACRKRSSR